MIPQIAHRQLDAGGTERVAAPGVRTSARTL